MAHASPQAEAGPRRAGGAGRVVAIVAVLLVALVAAALYWEVLRDRQPPIQGEIDDALVPTERLCVRGLEPPCRSLEEAARVLGAPQLVIRGAEGTSGGNQGVSALLVEAPDGARAKAKWRSQASSSLFNTPARELAAFHVQALLVEPEDYVIPPVASRCFELSRYRSAVLSDAAPFPGTRCVLGFLSYWVEGAITMPEARRRGIWPMPPDGIDDDDPQLYRPARFREDPIYRRNLAVLNLVTHVVNNLDAHAGQFVLYTEPWHAFLVDTSLAFRAVRNPRTLFIQDLSELVVPAIPTDVARRIREIERADVERLLVIEEHAIRDGLLVRVTPREAFDVGAHLRRRGDRIQIGLTAADVRGLWQRIEALQRALAAGRLRTF